MTKASKTSPKFEDALLELEQIVEAMEGDELELDQALAQFKRGNELLKYCRQKLISAEQQLQVLQNDELQAFSADDDDT